MLSEDDAGLPSADAYELSKYSARIALLEQQVAICRRNDKTMREALAQARVTIIELQTEQQKLNRFRTDKYRQLLLVMVKFAQPKEFYRSISAVYISRSRLESALLQRARLNARGIEYVVVDFVKLPEGSAARNWRVSGIANGTVESEEAFKAVEQAARDLKACVMVSDGNVLDGRRVKARPCHVK